MADPNDPVELYGANSAGEVVSYSVSDGTNIPINTMLKLSGDRTVSAQDGSGDIFVGVASSEKEADDGQTEIGAYTKGVFVFEADGAISEGDQVITGASPNSVATDNSEAQEGKIVGTALESADDGNKVAVKINK
ncbi:MAG: capsid cement protein [archaeon]